MCFLHSCIVTCGSDGDVRIWEDLDDDDPKSINVGEKAYSCALKVLKKNYSYWYEMTLPCDVWMKNVFIEVLNADVFFISLMK